MDVTVTTAGGTSATSGSDQFTWVPAPVVTSLSPSTGPALGGTTVVITGSSLLGATAVSFGSSAASSYTVDSATQITATSPAGTGTVNVTVTTPGGSSSTGAGNQFTFDAKAFAGALSGGGFATATFTGGGESCGFSSAGPKPTGFIAATTPLAGWGFPYGLFQFTLTGCDDSTVTMTIVYPSTPGTTYWKYGPTVGDTRDHWYQPTSPHFAGNGVSFTITDGGLGDDDMTPNGTIVDAGGPAAAETQNAEIPALSGWGLAVLSSLLALAGYAVARRLGP